MELLSINFISPISKYNFNMSNKYYLVFINIISDNKIIINKINLNNINNITKEIRGYGVHLAFLLNLTQFPTYQVKLFEHNYTTNILKLLFSTDINFKNQVKKIIMFSPSKIINYSRLTIYKNNLSFLQEQFYNFNEYDKNNICILFVERVKYTNNQIINNQVIFINPIIIDINNISDDNNDIIFNRYSNIINLELPLDQEYHYHYHYNDVLVFHKLKTTPYSINKDFRPSPQTPYLNNVILAPIDSRIIGFNNKYINNINNINLLQINAHLNNFIENHPAIINGSGFINKIMPQDGKKFQVPYNANITSIETFNAQNFNYNCTIFKFESNYYMPPDVHEREYASVIAGHATFGARIFPKLMDVSPDTYLIYYLLIYSQNRISLNNSKLQNNNTWFDAMDELGFFANDNETENYIIFLSNRKMDFAKDILYYSKLIPNNLNKQIECYVQMNDMIGLLK